MLRAQQTANAKENERMSDDYKVQASPTIGGVMFNLRGNTVEEVAAAMVALGESADAFFEGYDKVRQVTLAKGLTVVPSAAPSGAANVHPGTASGGGTGELRCQHGPYKDLNGKRKRNGEGYKNRYVCPAPFGAADQCRNLPNNEPWSA